jgi:L-fucose isomerase-like protein
VIACFSLLKELGTTSCLALSTLNDSVNFIGGCEGDLDSGITLLLMKALSGKPGWMSNPVVCSEDSLQLSHCSAPVNISGYKGTYVLRNHHESHTGVSPEVQLPLGDTVTMCRLGDDMKSMNAFTARTLPGEKLPVCRTQVYINGMSMENYLQKTLGCHIIMTYGDYTKGLAYLSRLAGMSYL